LNLPKRSGASATWFTKRTKTRELMDLIGLMTKKFVQEGIELVREIKEGKAIPPGEESECKRSGFAVRCEVFLKGRNTYTESFEKRWRKRSKRWLLVFAPHHFGLITLTGLKRKKRAVRRYNKKGKRHHGKIGAPFVLIQHATVFYIGDFMVRVKSAMMTAVS